MTDIENIVRGIVRDELAKPAEPAPIEEFLTTKQAAKVIGMSPGWLHQARFQDRADQPPFYRFDRAIRYRRSDLLDWIETSRRAVAS